MGECVCDNMLLRDKIFDALIVTKLDMKPETIDYLIQCGVPEEKITII